MNETPEDTREKAESIVSPALTGRWSTMQEEEISRALLAERQSATEAERDRCAKIAKTWSEENARTLAANVYGLSDHDIDVAQNTARGIEEAIWEAER